MHMEQKPKKAQNQLPEWLEQVQNQSWQIEMLITGGLVYSLLQLPEVFEKWYDLLIEGSPLDTKYVIAFVGLHLFSRALLLGFLTNLGLRTLWLAALGINFTFPRGIDYERLNYSKTFEEYWSNKPNQVKRIIGLERLCSISFSLSILLGIFSIGILICVYLLYFLLDFVLPMDIYDAPLLGYLLFTLLIVMGLGAMDRLFFGWSKKRSKASRRYLPFFRFFNLFNLSFIYKTEWFILISNTRRGILYSIIVLFMGISGILAVHEVGGYHKGPGLFHIEPFDRRAYKTIPTNHVMVKDDYYNQLEKGEKCYFGCISADIIDHRFMWLFVTYNFDFDANFDHLGPKKGLALSRSEMGGSKGIPKNDSIYMDIINTFIKVKLDTTTLENLEWEEYKLPKTDEFGYITYIDIDSLKVGRHDLALSAFRYNKRKKRYFRWAWSTIPFWKE